jgi:hypothetical protein
MMKRYSGFSAFGTLALTVVVVFFTIPMKPALGALHTCKSVDVSAFENRIHVRCNTAASGGIVFFAVPTANSAYAARVLAILTAAHVAGKKIEVEYNPSDTSGGDFGCLPTDCRRMLSVGIK